MCTHIYTLAQHNSIIAVFAPRLDNTLESAGQRRNELLALFCGQLFELSVDNSPQSLEIFGMFLIDQVLNVAEDVFYRIYIGGVGGPFLIREKVRNFVR